MKGKATKLSEENRLFAMQPVGKLGCAKVRNQHPHQETDKAAGPRRRLCPQRSCLRAHRTQTYTERAPQGEGTQPGTGAPRETHQATAHEWDATLGQWTAPQGHSRPHFRGLLWRTMAHPLQAVPESGAPVTSRATWVTRCGLPTILYTARSWEAELNRC